MLQKHNNGRIEVLNVTLINADLTWWRFRPYYRDHLKYQKEKRKRCHNTAKEPGSNKKCRDSFLCPFMRNLIGIKVLPYFNTESS